MKKLAALILTLVTAFVLSTQAFALTTTSVIPTATLNKILTDYRNALKAGDKFVSLSQYGVSGSQAENDLYDFFYRANGELGSISYGKYSDCYVTTTIDSASGSISGVSIKYWDRYSKDDGSCDMEHVKADQKTVSDRFSAAKTVAKSSMSDVEKALALYDYIISITNYPLPEEVDKNGGEYFPDDAYTTVGLLCDGYAVCEAYAKLYAILLNDAGLPAITVGSESMDHKWVMVKVDGEWYHCDPTWDDYRFDDGYTILWDMNDDNWDKGSAGHKYFLKSDDEFRENDHPNWEIYYNVNPDNMTEPPKSGKSGAFDDQFFSPNNENFACCTLMNYINGSWYFIDLKTMSIVRVIYGCKPEYIEMPANYAAKYSYGYGNYLYVCTNTSVLRYDTMSSKFEKILEVPEEDRETDAFSEMSIINDEMTVTTVRYTFDSEGEYKDAAFSSKTYPMSEIERMSSIPFEKDANIENDEGNTIAKDPESKDSSTLTRPGQNPDKKNGLSDEEKAMLENAETTGKRMMAFVYLAIAAIFIIIATVAIILTIKYIKKK